MLKICFIELLNIIRYISHAVYRLFYEDRSLFMLVINDSQLDSISGAGGGIGEAISGIGHVVEGATHVANAVNGGDLGEGLGQRWGKAGAKDYCSYEATENGKMSSSLYNDCMKNPAGFGYKDTGPWGG